MVILERRRYVEPVPYWVRQFDFVGESGWGYGFDCEEDGTVHPPRNPEAAANLAGCLTGSVNGHKVIDRGPRRFMTVGHYVPAVGKCGCGRRVELDGFTNTCGGCETDYDSNGQQLAPRSQWGEETGETAADILGGGDPFDTEGW